MSLSKKNLDKLNKFKKNKNLNNESKNISNYTNISNNENLISNPLNSEDPNKIFYSLIDNSESLEETSNVNNSLRKSEINQINICLLYTSPSPRDSCASRMPSSA